MAIEDERSMITYPTWEKYTVLSQSIFGLTIREKRAIFQMARSASPLTADLFFPAFGITFSEFAVWYTLGEQRKKGKR